MQKCNLQFICKLKFVIDLKIPKHQFLTSQNGNIDI